MKKLVLAVFVALVTFCFAVSYANAGAVKPGGKTKCNNAKSITIEVTGKSVDRTNGNAVIWKSSNATTIPITLGPGEYNGPPKTAKKIGMANKRFMGSKKVVLTGQTNFSRGDSIGDISGEVRIENTGTTTLNITCG